MKTRLLSLLVCLAGIQVSAQQANIIGQLYYKTADRTITIYYIIENTASTGYPTQIIGNRAGILFNPAVLSLDSTELWSYNGTDTTTGLNASDYYTSFGVDENMDGGSKTATIQTTGGSKTVAFRRYTRSTSQCANLFLISSGAQKIFLTAHFTLLPGIDPVTYNLDQPNYGFGTSQFIAEFVKSENPNFTNAYKEIGVIYNSVSNSLYQPYDVSGSKCIQSNMQVNPITVGTAAFEGPYTGILPVNFTSFGAQVSTSGTQLRWSISSAENAARFVVERSIGDGDFQAIAYLDQNGGNDYFYLDQNAGNTGCQYRILLVNHDGSVVYSVVQTIQSKNPLSGILHIGPNPGRDYFSITTGNTGSTVLHVRLYDLNGRMVKEIARYEVGNPIAIGQMPDGLYLVQAVDIAGGMRISGRLLKRGQ